MKKRMSVFLFVACLILPYGCASRENNTMNSTLWVHTSAEYVANSLQTYSAARKNVDPALKDRSWTAALEQTGDFSSLPAAVVMDIDQTVLDNSTYEARLVVDGAEWSPDTWDEWVALKRASAVPGAVDFIRYIRERRIKALFVTNRECRRRGGEGPSCPQERDTIDNLAEIGITGVEPEDILLKNEQPGWSSEKTSRRQSIVAGYRVLMLFGDDLGDFMPGVKKGITPAERCERVRRHRDDWGLKWYMLSNPMYGSWLNVLEKPGSKWLLGK